MLKNILRMLAKNFVFFVGFLFIFVFGFLYALLKPQGLAINIIFLAIVIGWVIFIIKYFWELLDKEK